MSIPGAASPLLLATAADEEFIIERSLRFNIDDSAYLNFTPSSAGNRKTWTWSAWVKRSKITISDYVTLFGAITTNASDYSFLTYNATADTLIYFESGAGSVTTSGVFRDSSAWAHICLVVDTTQSTAADAYKLYVNGSLASTTFSGTYTQNELTAVNSTEQHSLGSNLPWQGRYFDGYMAETHFIDGQALAASDFGEYDDNNVWQPKEYAGTYGTNGWHLDFSDATNTTTIAEDSSGNGNDWTANNISVTAGSGNDSLFDSPSNGTQSDTGAGGEVSGNYATLNPLIATASTLSNGNLDYASTATYQSAFSTIGVKTGKWYLEGTVNTFATDATIGVSSAPFTTTTYVGGTATSWGYEGALGAIYNNGSFTAFGSTYGAGDIIGVAFDADSGKLWFAKNGTWQASGNPATGANPAVTLTTGIDYLFGVSAGNTGTWTCNFGQRPFAYSAPSGYKCLCSANLPDPTIADGSTAMDVALYTGNSSTQTISGLNFSPDLVWIKNRSTTDNHKLTDTVRGATEELESNTTDAEVTNADGLTAFNSDGFDLGADVEYNTNTESYVAWAWDAGSSTVSNTDGSITSSVRANTSTGFSIVSYTGTSANATVGHGLNAAPEMIISKNRDRFSNWTVYHASLGATKFMSINNDNNAFVNSSYFNNTAPTSSVFSVGSATAVNYTGEDIIAYCFAPVEGYSAFGKFTGNGDADGPFIYTGFRPRWIMVKSVDIINSWYVLDTKRSTDNSAEEHLLANLTNAESSSTDWLDILSNGFKIRTTNTGVNSNTKDYIYAAFAEHPFKTARAR